MIRIALIGCGEHARVSHAAPLARYAAEHSGEIALAAACDVDLPRAYAFCRDFGFERALTSVDGLLDAADVDACVVVVPIERIAEIGVRVLERRIPCVIEKPLGASIGDAERLALAAKETGTPHMVSVNRRFLPYLNRAAAWSSARGPIRYVRATMVRHGRDESDFVSSTAMHAVDALRHLAGEVTAHDVEILRRANSAPWYVISLAFASGTMGRVEVLPTAGIVEESYELFGDGYRARVVLDGAGPQRSLELWHGGLLVTRDVPGGGEPEDVLNGSFDETSRFVEALRDGRRPGPEIADVLHSARICFEIQARALAPQPPRSTAGAWISQAQETVLRAVVDRLIPADDAPGGVEAGCLEYFARKFGGAREPGAASLGVGLDALDAEAVAGSGRGFAELSGDDRDELLRRVESGATVTSWPVEPGAFFALLVESTAEGFYGDPGNGGNQGEAAWRMCGFVERLRA